MRISRQRIFATLWLACVTAVTLEIAARLDDWVHFRAPILQSYDFEQLFRVTERGLRGVPHGRYLRWQLNSDGLHGPEISADAGRMRVLVYGASEAFGIYEDAGKEFPRALEVELNARTAARRYEVVNAGIPGMRVGSGLSLLHELHARVGPQVLVIYPTPTHYIGVSQPYCGRPPRPALARSLRWPGVRVAEKFKEVAKRSLPPFAMTLLRQASIAWHMRGQEPLERIAPRGLDALDMDLRCVVRAARDLRIVPILVTHANRFGNAAASGDADWLTGWRQQYPEMQEGGFLDLEDRANNLIRDVAKSEKVAFVDAAMSLGGQADWFADHAHFNNKGAAQMAILLAPAVLAASSTPTQP